MSKFRERMVRMVGERYADCDFGTFSIGADDSSSRRKAAMLAASQYADEIVQHRNAGRNLILIGTCGTGKDHLATAVIRAAIAQGYAVASTSGVGLVREMMAAARSGEPLDSKFQSRDFLLVSDIEPRATDPASVYVQAELLDLIDRRYRAKLPTIVTSNILKRDELGRVIGERSVDRLTEDAVVIRMEWPSHRTEVRNG